jgi:hypothetical protein
MGGLILMTATSTSTAPKFAGHETFCLRYGWPKKAVDGTSKDRKIFLSDDAMVALGVGKNMVRSIRHWGLVTGILKEDTEVFNNRGRLIRPSSLGELLFGNRGGDPYLEDPGTLWVLHWQLASNAGGPTTWYWAFNQFAETEFSKEKLVNELKTLAEKSNWKRVAESSLRRDVDCFLRTYVSARTTRTVVLEDTLDCPLVELGLILELEAGRVFSFARGEHHSLPVRVFAYALLQYWTEYLNDRQTITFDEVAYRPGSPGKVFKLSEDAISDYLDGLEECTNKAISYRVNAGLRQLYRHQDCDALKVLRSHYVAKTRGHA